MTPPRIWVLLMVFGLFSLLPGCMHDEDLGVMLTRTTRLDQVYAAMGCSSQCESGSIPRAQLRTLLEQTEIERLTARPDQLVCVVVPQNDLFLRAYAQNLPNVIVAGNGMICPDQAVHAVLAIREREAFPDDRINLTADHDALPQTAPSDPGEVVLSSLGWSIGLRVFYAHAPSQNPIVRCRGGILEYSEIKGYDASTYVDLCVAIARGYVCGIDCQDPKFDRRAIRYISKLVRKD